MFSRWRCRFYRGFYGSRRFSWLSAVWSDLCIAASGRPKKVKRVVLHIGQHKTGTTSTQNFVAKLSKFFIGKGIYYPTDLGGMGDANHFALNIVCLAGHRFSSKKDIYLAESNESINDLLEKVKKDLESIFTRAASKRCDSVLLSNEGLYLLRSEDEYQFLKRLFDKYEVDVEVICCFRALDTYRSSYKKQLKKQNIEVSQDEDSYRYVADNSWLFDYEAKKKVLESVFTKVSYFDYSGADNISTFLKVLGVKHPFVDFPRNNKTKIGLK